MNVDEGGVKDDEEIEGRRWRIFWIFFLGFVVFSFLGFGPSTNFVFLFPLLSDSASRNNT